MLTGNATHQNASPPLDLNRILKSSLKRNDRRKCPEKQEQTILPEINCPASLVKNSITLFNKLTQKIY